MTDAPNQSGVGSLGPMGAPTGASLSDLVSTLKGGVQNLGQLVQSLGTSSASVAAAVGALATATLGANLGGTSNPSATIVTNVGTSSLLVVAANSARINIAFHSPNPGGVNMWVVPSAATAVAGRGVLVLPGGTVRIPSTCGWNAIATSGSSNVLTILEWL